MPAIDQMHTAREFLAPKLHRLAEFMAAQGIALAARLLYGFLCIRLLPISEYAKFTVVFGFLGTLAVLMDFAFSGTLLPMVGERIDDRRLIADCVASLRQLARWVYVVLAPLAAVMYPILVKNQHWSWGIVSGMVAVLLVASWCSRVSGTYGAVLILRRERGAWYRVQIIANAGSLALLGPVWALHALNAFSAIFISLAAMIYTSLAYYFRTQRLLGVSGVSSPENRRAIVRLALPIMPNVLFYALQGQISIFLIAIFGHSTAVAGVGALGRLGQIFALFAQMSPLLIEPYFARMPEVRLRQSYIVMLILQGMFCLSIVALAAWSPSIFLWVLGPKYSNLRMDVLLMIAASATAYFSSILWFIHCARRFVYWWNAAAVILLTLGVEAIFIWKMDLSTVRGVLTLNLATAAVGLLVNLATGLYGLVHGPREIASAPQVCLVVE